MPHDLGRYPRTSTWGAEPARQRSAAEQIALQEVDQHGETDANRQHRLARRLTIRRRQAEREVLQREIDALDSALAKLDDDARTAADEHQRDTAPLRDELGRLDVEAVHRRSDIREQIRNRTAQLERETADIETTRESIRIDKQKLVRELQNIPTAADLMRPGIGNPRLLAMLDGLRAAQRALAATAADFQRAADVLPHGSVQRFRAATRAAACGAGSWIEDRMREVEQQVLDEGSDDPQLSDGPTRRITMVRGLGSLDAKKMGIPEDLQLTEGRTYDLSVDMADKLEAGGLAT